MGLHLGGFDVVGVDIEPQPRYPFEFHQADALEYPLDGFDFIWASPPCQEYSVATLCRGASRKSHPDLVAPTRARLRAAGVPWVMENVYGAPLHHPLMLCGLMFGLRVLRHRYFETSPAMLSPHHPSHRGVRIGEGGMICAAGHGGSKYHGRGAHRREIPPDHRSKVAWQKAMGIDWMLRDEMAQAIPPAYSRYIAEQMMPHVLRQMNQRASASRPRCALTQG
jgi:DNA (cytosine-5)-methyltransferase 1